VGNTATGSGTLPGSVPDWFTVTFTGNPNQAFHPAVSVTGAGVVFDIYTSCAGGGTLPVTCLNEGGNCTGKTTWETSYTCQSTFPGGDTSCFTGSNQGFSQIGTGTVYIKVYRPSGTPASCAAAAFSLSISN
jgi:hypothetical protein